MWRTITPEQWARQFPRQIEELRAAVAATFRWAAPRAAEVARTKIGHLQPYIPPGPGEGDMGFRAWAPLRPSTVAEKSKLGFGPPEYSPLLRTNELRNSIGWTATAWTFAVGSTSPVAVYHEFGTSKMAPRPFIGPSLVETIPVVDTAILRTTLNVLAGGVGPGAIWRSADE